jgi:hypothetical protein
VRCRFHRCNLCVRARPLLLTSTESATNVSFDPWFDPWLPCDFAKSIAAVAGVARSAGAQQRPSRPQRCESGELIKIVAATEVRARRLRLGPTIGRCGGRPDAERWRKGAEVSGQKKE